MVHGQLTLQYNNKQRKKRGRKNFLFVSQFFHVGFNRRVTLEK